MGPGKYAETEGMRAERALELILDALREREEDRFLDQRTVCELTTLHRNTIYKLEADGGFPRRRIVGAGKVVWLASEVLHWLHSRPTSEELRGCGGDCESATVRASADTGASVQKRRGRR